MFLMAFSAVKARDNLVFFNLFVCYYTGTTDDSDQAMASQDFNSNYGAYNALCSTDDYDKMVICQNNLLEVADKCYESCHDKYCELKCSETFYESLDGEFISSSSSFRKFYLNIQLLFIFYRSECPCHSKCRSGCSGCDNWTCGNACRDPSFPEASKVS